MDFWEVIDMRRSIRRYTDQNVPELLMERILRAACKAPSAHNSQPWHFTVIYSRQIRRDLARAMAAKYAADMREKNVPANLRYKELRRSMTVFTRTPLLIIAFLVPGTLGKTGDAAEQEKIMAVQSVAAACTQLLLAATASGLGACWYAAPLFCPAIIREQLGLDPFWEPQALITLGYPAQTPRVKKTLPAETSWSFLKNHYQ